MRISTKLTLALSIAGFVLFGGYGLHLVDAESRDLKSAVEGEVRLLGRSLQVAVENALRDRQLADVRETLDNLEKVDPNVDILIFDLEGTLSASSADSSKVIRAPNLGAEAILQWEPPGDPEHLVLSVPLTADGGRGSARCWWCARCST